MLSYGYKLMEKGLVPDFILRLAIRRLCAQRLQDEQKLLSGDPAQLLWTETLKRSPIAIETDKANEQHYEVPARFYELCLGKNLKYSSCWFEKESDSLETAETQMLDLYLQRAEIKDGMQILDLGCGWGSFTFHAARKFPGCKITGISNSSSQREFIMSKARAEGLDNIEIMTANINDFRPGKKFDRIVSIEMLEHVRNYGKLFNRAQSWLHPEGKMFVHIFCHKTLAYPFEVKDETDWMSKYFFTGGQMPSFALFDYFQDHLKVEKRWAVSGRHYSQTAEKWLENMDRNKAAILTLFKEVYGVKEAKKWFIYWRVFYLACAELFGYRGGEEWIVGHYLLSPELQTQGGLPHEGALSGRGHN